MIVDVSRTRRYALPQYWSDTSYTAGELLQITGQVDEYYGLTEINANANVSTFTIKRMGTDTSRYTPMNVTTGALGGYCNMGGEAYEGTVVVIYDVTMTGAANNCKPKKTPSPPFPDLTQLVAPRRR